MGSDARLPAFRRGASLFPLFIFAGCAPILIVRMVNRMDLEKKAILVKEIELWRRNKLLPEHYCDFLLNLYAAEAADKSGSWLGISSSALRNSSWKGWMLGGGIICFILLIGLNFTSFGISLQIGIVLLALLCFYSFAYRFRSSHPVVPNLLVGAGSLFLLVIGIYLMKLNDIAEPAALAGYVAGTSVIWLLTGLAGRMPIFHFSGWMGLVASYAWLLHQKLGELSWLPLQLSWIPLCVLFLWSGWLFQQRSKRVGAIMFLVGCIVWFVPELYGFIVPVDVMSEVLQLSLLGKMAAGVALLFLLRKKWIEWVA